MQSRTMETNSSTSGTHLRIIRIPEIETGGREASKPTLKCKRCWTINGVAGTFLLV